MIEKEKINFSIIRGGLTELNKKKLLDLLRKENNQSILAKLSDNIVFNYFDTVQNSNFIKLFSLKYNGEIIAYAVTAAKPEYLISEFKNLKVKIFLSLIFNLKILTLFNIIVSILNLDLIFFKRENIKKINENLNLNLIAVENKYQSQGIGSLFLKKIISHCKEVENSKYMTCETYDQRAINFYLDKCGFKLIGKKIRIPRNLHVLEYKF